MPKIPIKQVASAIKKDPKGAAKTGGQMLKNRAVEKEYKKRAKRYGTAAAVGGVGAAAVAHKQPSSGQKAQKADNIATGAATASVGAYAGGWGMKKVGQKASSPTVAKVASAIGKKRGVGAALSGATTGAALVTAKHVNDRDKQAGVSDKTRRKNVGMAAAGLGVDDAATITPKAARPVTNRVQKKGQTQNKGRSSCKGACSHAKYVR